MQTGPADTGRRPTRSTGAWSQRPAWCQLGACPLTQECPGHPPSNRHTTDGTGQLSCRLDDVMWGARTLPAGARGEEEVTCTALIAGGNSDHEPLEASLPCSLLGYAPPPPRSAVPPRKERRFNLP